MKKYIIAGLTVALIVVGLLVTNVTKADAATTKLHEYKYYISIPVEYGDTLTSIANDYITEEYSSIDEYIKEVKQLNSMGNSDKIYAGRDIIIPYYTNEKLH